MENHYKSTQIIFIRHGETEFNKQKLFFGHLNPPLNETGREQLKNTKILLEKMEKNIEIVYSSDLIRCVESMEILEIDEKIEKKLEKNFRELNFGMFEGKTYEQIEKEFPVEVEEMKNNWKKFKAGTGESLEDLMERVTTQIEKIVKEFKGKKILVVAHAGVIQTLISYYLTGGLDIYWKVKVDNGSISKMIVNEDNFVYFEYINRVKL